MTLFELADKHPVMVSIVALSAVVVAAIGHRTVKVIADALTGKRGQRKRRCETRGIPQKRSEEAATAPVKGSVLPEVRAALAALGYRKSVYEPILSTLDLEAPLPEIVRSAIKQLHNAKAAS